MRELPCSEVAHVHIAVELKVERLTAVVVWPGVWAGYAVAPRAVVVKRDRPVAVVITDTELVCADVHPPAEHPCVAIKIAHARLQRDARIARIDCGRVGGKAQVARVRIDESRVVATVSFTTAPNGNPKKVAVRALGGRGHVAPTEVLRRFDHGQPPRCERGG